MEEDKIKDERRKARNIGWSAAMNSAKRTEAEGASGGCAICARKGIGIDTESTIEVNKEVAHRITHAWVNGVMKGGVHVFSVYTKDTIGPTGENLEVLEELQAAIKSISGPWIIAADWNMSPEALAATSWLRMVEGRIISTNLDTCNTSVYDYFVVAKEIRHAVMGIQRIKDAGLQPHFPVRLLIKGNARRIAVRKLVKAPKVHGILPSAPANDKRCYQEVTMLAAAGKVTEAIRKWYELARKDWSDITGRDLQHKEPKFVWGSAVGRIADPYAGANFVSRLWRYSATTAKEAQKAITNKHMSGHRARVATAQKHIDDIDKKSKGDLKSLPEHEAETLRKWANSLKAAMLAESPKWCESLAQVASKKAEKIEQAATSKKQSLWREMVGGGTDQGGKARTPTGLAYRWSKGICGWNSSPTIADIQDATEFLEEPEEGEELQDDWSNADQFLKVIKAGNASGNVAPACDQVAVEKEAAAWSELWRSQNDYSDPFLNEEYKERARKEADDLPRLSVQDIRLAAKSFPIHTGLGIDNVSPRAFDRLSDEALQAIINVLHECERSGLWGECNTGVLTVMLPKPDGGVRPIGLLPTFIRIWSRARTSVAREWETKNANPSLFGGKQMGAQKAAWMAAIRAEVTQLAGQTKVQTLLDMTKAFETIPHYRLVQTAAKFGYNLALIRLSIASYRLPRTIGIDGVHSAMIKATRGITAGSGFATTELRLLMQEVVLLTLAEWGNAVNLTLYVDDLTVETKGDDEAAALKNAAVVDQICEILQNQMDFDVSRKKSVVVANKPIAAIMTAENSQTGMVRAVKIAKLLGTATKAGGRRAVGELKTRMTKFKKRLPKYQMLRRIGVNTAAMTQSAAAATMLYGVECCGIGDSMLEECRRTAAKACVGSAGGKSATRSLYAIDGAHGTADPAFVAHTNPITYWALAWWENWLDQDSLVTAFQSTKEKLSGAKGTVWANVKGPAGALIASAERIGWRFENAYTAFDEQGLKVDFRLDSPAAIKRQVKKSVRRWRLNQIIKDSPGLEPKQCDIEGAKSKDTVVIDCVPSGLTALSKKQSAHKEAKHWCRKHKPYLTSAVSGGQ